LVAQHIEEKDSQLQELLVAHKELHKKSSEVEQMSVVFERLSDALDNLKRETSELQKGMEAVEAEVAAQRKD
jgi:hypothetical protein